MGNHVGIHKSAQNQYSSYLKGIICTHLMSHLVYFPHACFPSVLSFKNNPYHYHADDAQVHLLIKPHKEKFHKKLLNYLISVKCWMANYFLELKDKTEDIILGPASSLTQLGSLSTNWKDYQKSRCYSWRSIPFL